MALDPDDAKKITDLGAAIASLQADLDKVKGGLQIPADTLKSMNAEMADLKAQIAKLTPAAPPVDAPEPEWLAFIKRFVSPW